MNLEARVERILTEFREDGVSEADIERFRPAIEAGLRGIEQKHLQGYDC